MTTVMMRYIQRANVGLNAGWKLDCMLYRFTEHLQINAWEKLSTNLKKPKKNGNWLSAYDEANWDIWPFVS